MHTYMFRLPRTQFIPFVCLRPRLQHAVFVCQLISYLATQGTENHTGPNKRRRSGLDMSKENILAVAFLSEKPVFQTNNKNDPPIPGLSLLHRKVKGTTFLHWKGCVKGASLCGCTCEAALLWSRRVKQEKFSLGMEGADLEAIRQLVLAGFPTTRTWPQYK